MSDTPETDANCQWSDNCGWSVDTAFARKLERQRNELRQALEMLYAVTPAEAPAKGILQGIEAKHAAALEATRKALANTKP